MARIVTKDFEIMPIQFNKAMSRAELRSMPFVENNARLNQYYDAMLDTMIVELKSYVLAKKHVGKENCSMSISVPATAWQHVKRQYAPKWFLRRWPVEYRTDRTSVPVNYSYYMCPHHDIKWDGQGSAIHMAFMCKPGHDEYGEPIEYDVGVDA